MVYCYYDGDAIEVNSVVLFFKFFFQTDWSCIKMSTEYVERTETTTTATGEGISLQHGYLRSLKSYLKIGEMVGHGWW